MTKELIEGTPKDGCGEGLCTACAAHDFTPSLGAVREAQRGLANEHISGDEIVAAFDRMIEKLVADALATRVPVQGEPNDDYELVDVVLTTADIEELSHLLVQLSPATQKNSGATMRRLMQEMNIKEVAQ